MALTTRFGQTGTNAAERHVPPSNFTTLFRTVKVLASDFDGCIGGMYGVRYQDDPLVKIAAELVAARGNRYEFAVVSGGRVSRLKDFADMVGAPLFAENGGVLYNPKSQSMRTLVEEEKVRLVMEEVAPKVDAFLDGEFPGYEKHEKYTMVTYDRPAEVPMGVFANAVSGFVFSRVPREVRMQLSMTFTDRLVDITVSNKSIAIKLINDFFNVDGRRMAYIGDGSNDIPAFESVLAPGGIAVMPKNSDKPVKDFISRNSNHPRIVDHPYPSTECVIDVLQSLQRAA